MNHLGTDRQRASIADRCRPTKKFNNYKTNQNIPEQEHFIITFALGSGMSFSLSRTAIVLSSCMSMRSGFSLR